MPRRSDQVAWIRHQAAVLWAKKGFHATSMEDLCKATDLGRGALYYHIDSKDKLLFEICLSIHTNLIESALPIVERDADTPTKIRLLSEEHMRNLFDDLAEWTVSSRDGGALRGKNRERITACRDEYEEIWKQLLRAGEESGELRPMHPLAVKGLLGMLNYSYFWVSRRGSLKP
jgi:AcrR family transcriptional regulator